MIPSFGYFAARFSFSMKRCVRRKNPDRPNDAMNNAVSNTVPMICKAHITPPTPPVNTWIA